VIDNLQFSPEMNRSALLNVISHFKQLHSKFWPFTLQQRHTVNCEHTLLATLSIVNIRTVNCKHTFLAALPIVKKGYTID
jgi:hypothetical protein